MDAAILNSLVHMGGVTSIPCGNMYGDGCCDGNGGKGTLKGDKGMVG